MITQIYEVRNPDEARQLVAVGVDHIGVLVGDGEFPRELNLETAKKVFKAVLPPTKRIALSLSRNLRKIEQIVNEIQPTYSTSVRSQRH